MGRIEWDKTGKRYYETGVDRAVLYHNLKNGIAWSGISSITESSDGGELTATYADNGKYLSLVSVEELKLAIEAYQYPSGFRDCLGEREVVPGVVIGQQTRHHFGLCYRSMIGNDEEGTDFAYKLHLIYDCLASPAEHGHNTVNDSPEAEPMSWDVSTTAAAVVDGYKPAAAITLDSRRFQEIHREDVLAAIEDILYGTEKTDAILPSLEEILNVFGSQEAKYITDSDGGWLLDSSGAPLIETIV